LTPHTATGSVVHIRVPGGYGRLSTYGGHPFDDCLIVGRGHPGQVET